MRGFIRRSGAGAALIFAALLTVGTSGEAARAAGKGVTLLPTPNGGIQPQAVLDARGTLHLIYFKGKDTDGDLFYVRREKGHDDFSAPIRVNSQPGSAVAAGTIRGGQLAVGKGGRVHVVWNGSHRADARAAGTPQAPHGSSPLLYARLDDSGQAFEPQRNLMQKTFVLDGGGTVAADREGNVYVSWHAVAVGTPNGEANRQVWVAHSADDGRTFGPESVASPQLTGACACCGMKGFADSTGALHLLYRAATEGTQRDMYLLTSRDRGQTFTSVPVQPWVLKTCPMSSEAFAEGPGGVRAAWETEGKVYFTTLRPGTDRLSAPLAAPGGRNQKHPALAVSPAGETLLAWTEGTGWKKGGALAWQVYGADGRPTAEKGRREGAVPVWGLPAVVVAGADGGFIVIH